MECVICKIEHDRVGKKTCGSPACLHKNLIRAKRNKQRREENAILRELCGTSAAAARRDMGL